MISLDLVYNFRCTIALWSIARFFSARKYIIALCRAQMIRRNVRNFSNDKRCAISALCVTSIEYK